MLDRELSTDRRFNRIWDSVNSDNGQVLQTEGMPAVVLAHQEPYVTGSLRPSVKTLRLITWDTEISLNNLQSTFMGRSEYVQSVLSLLESTVKV